MRKTTKVVALDIHKESTTVALGRIGPERTAIVRRHFFDGRGDLQAG